MDRTISVNSGSVLLRSLSDCLSILISSDFFSSVYGVSSSGFLPWCYDLLIFILRAPCSYNEAGDRTCVKQGKDNNPLSTCFYSTLFMIRPCLWRYRGESTDRPSDDCPIMDSWASHSSSRYVSFLSLQRNSTRLQTLVSKILIVKSYTAAVVSLLAVILALSQHLTIALWATLVAWLAGLITFIAFLCDVVLFAHTRTQFKKLNLGTRTIPGPGKPYFSKNHRSNPTIRTNVPLPLLPRLLDISNGLASIHFANCICRILDHVCRHDSSLPRWYYHMPRPY